MQAHIQVCPKHPYAAVKARVQVLDDALGLMISYLGHQDQDANHLWMVEKMRDARAGKPVHADIEAAMAELAEDA